MNNKTLIFDGNSIINRAFYAVRPLITSGGLHTNALYGFVNILKKHIDHHAPTHCAVAFDLRAPTFRHKAYDGYKAKRRGMPEELAEQMPYARELVRLLGLTVLECEGYEADDILGAVSRLSEKENTPTVLVTGDRDSLQLVSDLTTVMLCTTGEDVQMTPQAIFDKYGLTPAQLIDLKAIMGDTSDNIPGVRGIGEKGALDLMHKAGSLDAVYENLETLGLTRGVKEKLIASREDAYLSRMLGTILREVPCISSLEQLTRQEMDRDGLRKLFTKLEFTRLAEVFDLGAEEKWIPSENQIPLDIAITETPAEKISTLSLSKITSPCCALVLEDELFVIGDNVVWGKIQHEDVCAFSATFSPIVFGAKEYYYFCASHGAPADTPNVLDDVQLMAYLADPSGAASSLYRAATVFSDVLLSPADPVLMKLCALFGLWRRLTEGLEKNKLTSLYRDIELPLAKVLFEMEREGILLDRAALSDYGNALKTRIFGIEEKIYAAAGAPLNLNSPKQLGVLLFETLSLPHAKKTKTGYSTDAETLEKLRPLSPVVADILEYRKLQKLYSTYVEGLLKQTEKDARVHTTFLQAQTITGRLASQNPNLQNIPVRTPEGREIRRFFVAKEGHVFLDADYSQVELRILAHLSGDPDFLSAFRRGEDIHQKTASEIFHVPLSEVTAEMRKDAKAINFGIVYGIGDYSLSQDLGVPMKVAADYIQKYFRSYPKVKEYLDSTIAKAKEDGFVSTMFGRRRFVPELSSTKKSLVAFGERVAMNTPIQGAAADIMKLAMVHTAHRLKKEGLQAKILLQVHDELLLECPKEEAETVARLLKEEMENACSLSLTLTAEVGCGKNWLDAK